jgi:hypothetical protein
MRIETPKYTERFGLVRTNDVQTVLVLDSSRAKQLPMHNHVRAFPMYGI